MSSLLEKVNDLWREVRRGNLSPALARYGDLLLPVAVMLAIGTLIIPISPPIISVLVVLNLAVSLVVLLTALYIKTPVQLTSYPTILLLTTLFRLCLSVSVARSILGRGTAGDVIEMLGQVPGGGDIVVGAVVFLMILVVQFIVVAKGAERIAEVSARFTLDALPGKQLSIGADVNAGVLTQEQALRARAALQQESHLYGAMDGAMKFVKGDSIATIVIALINIAAGFAIGVFEKEMTLAGAARTYTILTIGDGLAAIIASMLITVSAGIVVTRVASDDVGSNAGSDIGQQFFKDPKPLMLASGLLMLLGLALALIGTWASVSVLVVGAALGGLALLKDRGRQSALLEARRGWGGGPADEPVVTQVHPEPFRIGVGPQLTHFIDAETESGAAFRAVVNDLRKTLYHDLGVLLPNVYIEGDMPLRVRDDMPPGAGRYFIAVKDVPVAYGVLRPGYLYVNNSAENIQMYGLDGEDMRNPADGSAGAWIPEAQRAAAEDTDLEVREPWQVLALHLSFVFRQYAHEFVGVEQAQRYLNFAAQEIPKLVEEVVPAVISLPVFAGVLKRLVQEGISIKDVQSLLDALSQWSDPNRNPDVLAEFVRTTTLKRHISFKYTQGTGTLYYYEFGFDIEGIILEGVMNPAGLKESLVNDILNALRFTLNDLPPTAQKPVLVTDLKLRRFVRDLVTREFPMLTVLSYQELLPEVHLEPLKTITLQDGLENQLEESDEERLM
jgi:type III secretion protein V